MNLAELQRLFWRAITWPTGIDEFLRQSDEPTRVAFEQAFAQTPSFPRRARMEVYARAYFFRLLEVLADQFEVTAWLLGTARFHDLVTDYVWAHPSTDPDVRRFGARFPAFVAEHDDSVRVPGLSEVAAIEQAIVSAIDAADETPLSADALRNHEPVHWPRLRFVPTRTTALFSCRLPFSELWQRCRNDEPIPSAPPPPLATPAEILVWRSGHDVYQRSVAPAEARALRALLRGETFETICQAARGGPRPAEPTDVAGWLRTWLNVGLVAAAG